jgi:hypothetical protein
MHDSRWSSWSACSSSVPRRCAGLARRARRRVGVRILGDEGQLHACLLRRRNDLPSSCGYAASMSACRFLQLRGLAEAGAPTVPACHPSARPPRTRATIDRSMWLRRRSDSSRRSAADRRGCLRSTTSATVDSAQCARSGRPGGRAARPSSRCPHPRRASPADLVRSRCGGGSCTRIRLDRGATTPGRAGTSR